MLKTTTGRNYNYYFSKPLMHITFSDRGFLAPYNLLQYFTHVLSHSEAFNPNGTVL